MRQITDGWSIEIVEGKRIRIKRTPSYSPNDPGGGFIVAIIDADGLWACDYAEDSLDGIASDNGRISIGVEEGEIEI